ncbi:uncharacterized protein LOC124167014 [Ischnura elegans]|uniref:uncharacterized protein LOC124167014 n=1 Tax=Ischnura elegans TaxID=197161 RepID=UPI001ED89A0E|nr:uncharacterized protein LOC124167014 [Ischnura elegans]
MGRQMSLSPMMVLLTVAALASQVAAEGNDVDKRVEEVINDNSDDAEATHPIYEFVYEVGNPELNGGDRRGFGHRESRDGTRTWGTYFQQLSDGRLQTVRYWVDQSGYHAEVEYAGEPKANADWDDAGLYKKERLVARGKQEQKINQKPKASEEQSPLVQALLDSFPRVSLQTKRSSTVGSQSTQIAASAPSRNTEGRSSSQRQALRPIPVTEYALRWARPRGSSRMQTRRPQASDDNK